AGARGARQSTGSTGAAAPIPLAVARRSRWTVLGGVAAVLAAGVLLVFALQAPPFLPLVPLARPTEPNVLPAALPVTVAPAQAQPVHAEAADAEALDGLSGWGLSAAQVEELRRQGVLLLTHHELPAWQSAGLEPALSVQGAAVPTYLTTDAVYNLFLIQMQAAVEHLDESQNAEWGRWFKAVGAELKVLQAQPGFEPRWEPLADRLARILATGGQLAEQPLPPSARDRRALGPDASESERLAMAGDGVWSPLLLRRVDYAWIRQHASSRTRRWMSFIGTEKDDGMKLEDRATICACLKLWWAVLQEKPALWQEYARLALATRAAEAGTPQAQDLIDLHDRLTALCGSDPTRRFAALMSARAFAEPIGILPAHTPFRDELAEAMGAMHSFVDGVIANPAVDRTPFKGLGPRAAQLDAYLQKLSPDAALLRWDRLFQPVVQPPAAWPYTTAAWREKSDRLLAAAWVGTAVGPARAPAVGGGGAVHFERFEAAPNFYHRLRAMVQERATTLAADDPAHARLEALAAWLDLLTHRSLDVLAGRPVESVDLPAALCPTAGSGGPDCRVALEIGSKDAGLTDLLMGNGPPAQLLILQRDAAGRLRVFVGAVSNPLEGMAHHDPAGPAAAWRQMTADGVLDGFQYNGR
ncbi:MAG: hypothetical protein ACREJ2_09165, partial [Planctomycetota bacterium]